MRLAFGLSLVLVFGCNGSQAPLGRISVVAETLTTGAQITRVTVLITPSGVRQDLAVDPANATRFTGSFDVPVGAATVTAQAFAGSTLIGSGSASVNVQKGAHVQALITVVDTTGPGNEPDHSPVVTSLVAPVSAQVGDHATLTATAMDGDGDPLAFSWTALPADCGTFATPTAPSTDFTAQTIGGCVVKITVTAGGKTDSKSAPIAIGAAMGSIDITVTYVPYPLIGSIAFFNPDSTPIVSVPRNTGDATIRLPFHKGTPYTVTMSFDPWPSGTISLSDSCGGTIVPPAFVPGATSASATWTPTVNTGACIVTATLKRETLTDTFFVVVLPVP